MADRHTIVYPEVTVWFYNFVDGWVEVTADVVGTIEASYGIMGNGHNDRVASPGVLTFVLNNGGTNSAQIEGWYDPFSPALHMPGFELGIWANIDISYDGISFQRFFGYVTDIQPGYQTYFTKVTATDWMSFAADYPIVLTSAQYNMRIDQAASYLYGQIPMAVYDFVLHTGSDTFPTVFDTTQTSTTALTEFQKLALSELGYIYIRHDPFEYETLVVEGRHWRNSDSTLKQIPVASYLSGFMEKEDGDYLLLETGDKIMLNQTEDVVMTNFSTLNGGIDFSSGSKIHNYITVSVYPRRLDTVNQVLYSATEPIELIGGDTKVLTLNYRNPANFSERISGRNMVTPVSGTDYNMYTTPVTGGSDITANLFVTVVFGSSSAQVTLYNNSVTTGYIRLLQLRGLGVYIDDAVSYVAQDATSIAKYGHKRLSINMKYQNNTTTAKSVADVILQQDKDPKQALDRITYVANLNEVTMRAFLYTDIGDLVYIIDGNNLDGYFYIQSIDYKIRPGGFIVYTWTVKEALSLNNAFWILGTSVLGVDTVLGY